MSDPKIIVALDFDNEKSCLNLLQQLDPLQCRVKIGKELFVRTGPKLVEKVRSLGFDVFLDLKFYDIPNTVAAACKAAADLEVWMVNIHASGGVKMMQAAQDAVSHSSKSPLLIAVTILTSFNDAQLKEIGFQNTAKEQVLHLAKLTKQAGLAGVVCSPLETMMLKKDLGKEFILVTPGVRPTGSVSDDQQRIMTPQQALQAGSDYLVIGRPITAAKDPLKSLQGIIASIG